MDAKAIESVAKHRATPRIRGYFGIGIENVKTDTNVGSLWRSAQILGASFMFTIGHRYRRQASDTTHASRHVPLYHYDDFSQFRAHQPTGTRLIGVELVPNAVTLERFVHPSQAVYLLGAEDYGMSKDAIAQCDKIIQLPGPFCLNVAVAGAIVMYDRSYKQRL